MTTPDIEPDVPDPAEMLTALALASDGKLYFRIEDATPPDRPVFVGYALQSDEIKTYGMRRLLEWATFHRLAVGSDGQVYVEEGAMETEGRNVFRGFAATEEEAEQAAAELHRIAFNITVAVLGNRVLQSAPR